jgi:hypothetical protein
MNAQSFIGNAQLLNLKAEISAVILASNRNICPDLHMYTLILDTTSLRLCCRSIQLSTVILQHYVERDALGVVVPEVKEGPRWSFSL